MTRTARAICLVVAALMAVAGTSLVADALASNEAAKVLGPGAVTVAIGIEHSHFQTEPIAVRPGTRVRFVIHNGDPIGHEFIVGPPSVHARHASGTESSHPPVPGEVSVEPGGSAVTTYDFGTPGTVQFACHLPGHLAYGMTGEVRVTSL
jgi:uncharacterized cupredoxin-like copper-binding protein